jgi:hypothetical protein
MKDITGIGDLLGGIRKDGGTGVCDAATFAVYTGFTEDATRE